MIIHQIFNTQKYGKETSLITAICGLLTFFII